LSLLARSAPGTASSARFIANRRWTSGTRPTSRKPRLRAARATGFRTVAARGEPAGRGEHVAGDRPAQGFVAVQRGVARIVERVGEDGGKDGGERHPVLDAGVHALATGRAVDM